MKLCWLIPDDRGGGVVSVALSCARQARAAGHAVTVLMLLPPTGWLREQTDVPVESLHRSDASPDAPAAIVEWLDRHRPDVVLLNGCGQADLAIPFVPEGVRCVYVVHDTAPMYWQAAVDAQASLDAIVAVSETVARKFAARIAAPGKLQVVPNGSVFPPPPDLAAPRADDLLFLGGGNPTKGAGDVLEVWRSLVRQGFGGNLHWFGPLEPAFRRQVMALPQAAARVVCHGRSPRQAVFDAAARCKVLLMLSRVEPFGMATIEAMSMGCVPVAWDIETGTTEIVQPETRFFAPLGDRDALAGQVRRVCREHGRLAPLVMRRAREHYGEDTMWREGYQPLLEAVTGRPAAHRDLAGQTPPPYAPRRRWQMLPAGLRQVVRHVVGRSPRLGYWLRDLRGV